MKDKINLAKMFFKNWWKALVTITVLLAVSVTSLCIIMFTVSKSGVSIHTDKFDVRPK